MQYLKQSILVEDSKKLLIGWKYPLYYGHYSQEKTEQIIKVLTEGVPRECLKRLDPKTMQNCDFIASINIRQPDEIEIEMVSNFRKDEYSGGFHPIPILIVPMTPKAWLRRMNL